MNETNLIQQSSASPLVSPREVEDDGWTTIIRPRSDWFDLSLVELWKYRALIRLFVRRDLVAQYKQTILGPFWFLAQPILTTIVFTLVFGIIAKHPLGRDSRFFVLSVRHGLLGIFFDFPNS